MQLGISSYAYGWAIGFDGARPERPMTELDLVQRAAELDVGSVQIADNLPLEDFSSDRIARLKQAASQAGIRIEVGSRWLTVERIERYAEIARSLGSPFMRFVIDSRGYEPGLEEVRQTIADSLPLLGDVVLAIENHDRFKARDLRRLLESLDSPLVGICLDTANSLGANEGTEAVLNELARWTVNVHIKDIAIERVDTKMGFHVSGRPAGGGQLDIPAILKAVGSSGRCHSATLELWTPREATLPTTIAKEAEWVVESCRYLKRLWGETR